MKIVFVVPDMAGGGTERVITLLANEYVRRNIEVTILLFAGNRVAYELNRSVEVINAAPASKGSIGIIFRRIIVMRRFFKKNKDCHIFSFSTMGTVFSVIATFGIPHHLLVSERIDPNRSPHKLLFKWAYGFADKIAFQTPDAVTFFSKKIIRKAVVIPNPVDNNLPERFSGERKKKIVAVGRLEEQKNHKLLLNAFTDIHRKYPDYSLHIYGVGPLEEQLKQYAVESGIAAAVVWEGFSADVKSEIADAKMYVLSSDYEGMSNSLMEAMAIGVPVIATDCPVGGARMLIENEVNGLLVPVGDQEKMVAAMERLISDSKLVERISTNSLKIRMKYSLKEIADQFLQITNE